MSSKFKKKIRKILLTALAVVITLLIAFPIIWMLPAAFKTRGELFQIPNTFFPKTITLENFRKVFSVEVSGSTFLKSMAITFLVSCLSTFFSLFVNSFAGYVFARMEFRGKKILWGYFLFSMFVPGITIMLTSIRVVNILKMTDTIFVLFIPALANAYHIFFFRQFYYNIPSNIEEAATIDGASKIGVYFRIFLPMSTTPMIITGVGVFMASWNNFIWPTLTITNNADLVQIMQIIRTLNSTYAGEYGVVIAATIIALFVPITIFAVFQKRIVEGIALTGGK